MLASMLLPILITKRPLAAGIAAIACAAMSPAVCAAVPPGATTLVCSNPAGRVSWRIHIDFARHTVDANPARISGTRISWLDRADGRHYTLDRRSGDLTVVVTSSSGGYFLHDRCAVK